MSCVAMTKRQDDLLKLELELIGIDLILTRELDQLKASSRKVEEERRRPKRPNP